MLFTLAVLVIGVAVLSTGPVKAVIVNFNQTGIRTTVDSLLCPNTTYTFFCEISGDVLQLASLDNNGSIINTFAVLPANADAGTTISQSEFNFTAFNSENGSLGARAVMKASTNLSSVQLVCRDGSDGNTSSLGTVVKDPLDAPSRYRVYVTSFTCDNFATFVNVTWDDVDCAFEYVLDISDIGSITTTETTYETSFTLSARNISGNLSAVGGSALPFFDESLVSSNPDAFTCPTQPPEVVGLDAIPVYERSCCGEDVNGYDITFIDFPSGGRAYYETADGTDMEIAITDGVAEIRSDSNVTIYIIDGNGAVYYSQKLLAPSVSGQHSCCLWLILVIVLFVILCCLLCAFAIVIIVKKCFGESKVANQEKLRDDHYPDVTEMKTRGSDM